MGNISKYLPWYHGERQSATSAKHEGLSCIGSSTLSQSSEELKPLKPKHKIHRKPVPFSETHSAVQGAAQTNSAPTMQPGSPGNLVKSDASRWKLTTGHDKRRRKHGDHSTRSSSPQISDANLTRPHRSYQPSLWAWIDHIPQSADDATIIFNVQQVFTLAEQYVNNFYVDRPSQSGQCEPFLGHKSFENLPVGIQPTDVLHIVAQPTAMIKHSLIALLLSTISLTGNEPYSLLPSEFTALARAASSGRGFDTDIDHYDAAFASHRVLLSYLCPAMADDPSYVKARNKIIDHIMTYFECIFNHWLDGREVSENRLPNLLTLLQQTANLGILLFSQPSAFEFNWQISDLSPSGIDIPIAPRMLKISDEHALEVRPSQHMVRIKRIRTQQIANPPQKLIGESTIDGQRSFDRQAPPAAGAEVRVDPPRRSPTKNTVLEIRPLNASHVNHWDADQLDYQAEEIVPELVGDSRQRINNSVHELPVPLQAKALPQRGHSEARRSRRYSYDRGAANAELHGRPGELADNTRTPGQAKQGQLMMTDPKARTQQPYGPNAYLTKQSSYPPRGGSMDRGRSDSESGRDRRRSRSANGAMPARSSTWNNPDSTPGNESGIPDTVAMLVVDQHTEMRSGSARAREHKGPAAATSLPTDNFNHAPEVRPTTHQEIRGIQTYNERTEIQPSREQDFRNSHDNRTFPEAGQAQLPTNRRRPNDSTRKTSESSRHKRWWVSKIFPGVEEST